MIKQKEGGEKKGRKAHIINKQKKIQVPRFRIYFDSESRVDEETLIHKPYLICATFVDSRYDKKSKKVYTFDSLPEFWADAAKFGNKTKSRVMIYAHNAGYDTIATGGVPALVTLGYKVEGFFEKGLCFMLNLKNEQTEKSINIISSTNYYSTSLKKLGEAFNLPKLDFAYNEGSVKDAEIYCGRDVDILELAMETFIKFIQVEELGTLGITTPSQSFNAFRYRFMDHSIYIHDIDKAIEIERACYYGGRAECWRIGKFNDPAKYWKYDVNSMYPFVMRYKKYPVRLRTVRQKATLSEAADWINRGFGLCAKCKVILKDPIYPIKINDRLIFPIGDFYTFLTTPEIEIGLKNNYIVEIQEISIYDMEDIFSSYIEYFYTKRLEAKAKGEKVLDMLYKLFMNSLYGKFGQRANKMEKVGEADPALVEVHDIYDADTGERYCLKTFGGSVFKETGKHDEAFNAFCGVAAHVTAYARCHLWDFIEKAGLDTVYYMDTDSLFLSFEGRERLKEWESETELGGMKLEESAETMQINSPKDYSFGETVKKKGISKGSLEIDLDTWESIQFPKINSFLREGQLNNYHNIKRIKKLLGKYYKGWVLDTGQVAAFEMKINESGENEIRDWDNTSYASAGHRLKNRGQIKDIEKQYKGYYFDEEKMQDAQLKIFEKEEKEEGKRIRKLILDLGGIKDKDYRDIPRSLKRTGGQGLDELALELSEHGYICKNADAVYKMILKL